MKPKLIAGNWKMHGRRAVALPLAREICDYVQNQRPGAEVLLCPPATLLSEISQILKGSAVMLGGQDCASKEEGAYTGDISAYMLKETGCTYAIVGHSERRQYHCESDDTVKQKAKAALAQGLTPIICIGETLAEREQGVHEAGVGAQVKASIPDEHAAACILAYEPVWAIGTGKTPTLGDIESMHACIARAAPGVRILYGGSVKPENAKEIMQIPLVSGALVGGASLKACDFCAIIEAADNLK